MSMSYSVPTLPNRSPHSSKETFSAVHRHGLLCLHIAMLDQLLRKFFQKLRRMAGDHVAKFFASLTVADREGFHSASDPDIKKAALFVNRTFQLRTRMRQQTFFHPHNVDVRKLKSFAAMHCN